MSRCIASRSRLGDRARRVAGEVVRVEHHTPQRDQPSTNHTTATATRHAAAAAAGAAACRVVLAAPDAAGEYTGSATGSTTGALGNFSVQVTAPSTELPATGSNGVSTMTIIALGLFAVGGGLFIVSQVRRRQSVTI